MNVFTTVLLFIVAIDSLVEVLITSTFSFVSLGDKNDEISFRETFLSTYRSFTDARTLMELLIKRYEMEQPGDLRSDEFEQWKDMKLRPTQMQSV